MTSRPLRSAGVMGSGSTEMRDDSTDVLLGGRGVGSGCGLAHRAAAAPAQRSRPPLRAGGRPGHFRCGAGPLRHRCSPTSPAARSRPKLTDWRGEPPRDDWSLPPITLAADLPDRTAGVSYSKGTTARRLTQIGAAVRDAGDSLTVTPPSWRPDLLQPADLVEEVLRLEGLDVIPSVLPSAPAGRGLSADAAPPPRDRQVAGAVRLRRDPADAVPARRGFRRLGAARRRRTAAHHPGAQPVRSRSAASGHDAAAGSAWRRWRATSPAASSTSRCSRSRRWCSRPRRPRASS